MRKYFRSLADVLAACSAHERAPAEMVHLFVTKHSRLPPPVLKSTARPDDSAFFLAGSQNQLIGLGLTGEKGLFVFDIAPRFTANLPAEHPGVKITDLHNRISRRLRVTAWHDGALRTVIPHCDRTSFSYLFHA